MYSVDVLGNHIKRSFGTAFKPIDMRNPAGSVAMAVAAVALLFLTPSITVFYDGITSRPMWASLNQRLLPQDNWFGVVINRQVAAKPAPVEAPQTTGSLPTAPAAEGVANPATP